MKIVSSVYSNAAIRFGESIIDFKNGAAEISEELFKEIKSSGFPNIYKEGENPGSKTKSNENFDKTIKELNFEYMEEIDRLKKVNAARFQENKELKQQLENLKASYDKDIKHLQNKMLEKTDTPAVSEKIEIKQNSAEEAPSESNEEKEIRKDLESMKLPELQKIAIDQGSDSESLKKLTKKELIDVIMGKTE